MPKRAKGDVAGQKRRWSAKNRDRLNAKARERAAEKRGGPPRPPREPSQPKADTKRVVYIIGHGWDFAPIKFGITEDSESLRSRLRRLQCGNPYRLRIFAAEEIRADFCGARRIEAALKKMTAAYRCSGGLEWRMLSPREANRCLEAVLHKELVLNNPYMVRSGQGNP